MVPDQIEREIVIAAPPEGVWAALTDPQHLGTWFGDAGAEVDLRPGGLMTLRWKDDGAFLARVERVEPPHRFAYRWARPAETEPGDGNSTLVEFTLKPEGPGTRLRVVESGFRRLASPDEEKIAHVEENTGGWIAELDELRIHLEQPAA